MTIDQIIESYAKIMDIAPKTKDNYLESKICQMYDDIDIKNFDSSNIDILNALINKNNIVLNKFCNIKNIKDKIYNKYQIWKNGIMNNSILNYNDLLCGLLKSVIKSPIVSEIRTCEMLIELYNNGTKNGNYKVDRLISSDKQYFELIICSNLSDKYKLLNAFMNFMIYSIHTSNNSSDKDINLLVLMEYIEKEFGKYNLRDILPCFYLRAKIFINNTSFKMINIPTNIKSVDKYIESIDPGFKYMFETISKIKLNKVVSLTTDHIETTNTNTDDEDYDDNEDDE
jgi:hypothetical protein